MWNTFDFRFISGPLLLCGFLLQMSAADLKPSVCDAFEWIPMEQDSTVRADWAGKRTGILAPLNIPLILAGNFGELRTDHFHTGLDFKTQGKEGFPVLAASDGVVSRVKISPFGYGRALYLSGSKGLTTVYAHLQRFAPAIEQWALDEQYDHKRFAVDERPIQSFVYCQGDTIGWSGNSGGSGGPHLHFEIRETITQKPLNPLLWDLPVTDHRAPELQGVWLLPTEIGSINGRSRPVKLERGGVVVAKGGFRVAIDALDRLDAANNRCGIYKAEMRLDDEVIFAWELDALDFSVNRDMNAHAYFPAWNATGEQVHRMHRLPGNRLPIYTKQTTSGIISCDSTERCQRILTVRVWDVHGNAAANQWNVVFKATTPDTSNGTAALDRFDRSKTHTLSTVKGGIKVMCPARAFYEDFIFDFASIDSNAFHIGTSALPVSKPLQVALRRGNMHGNSEDGCTDQTAVRFVGEDGEGVAWYHGECQDSIFSFSTRQLGRYEWSVDSIAPLINPHRRHRTQQDSVLSVATGNELRFNLKDDGVGVDDFTAMLDGEWILMRWDPKRERIWYDLGDGRHCTGQQQRLIIEAKDESNNRSQWIGWVQF
jgi:hypothetical protein